jgi:hypothetical protein
MINQATDLQDAQDLTEGKGQEGSIRVVGDECEAQSNAGHTVTAPLAGWDWDAQAFAIAATSALVAISAALVALASHQRSS